MTLSKNKEKFIRSLNLKKFRQKYNNFIVEGDKMVRELLQHNPRQVAELYAVDHWMARTPQTETFPKEKLFTVSSAELKRISNLNTPNQVLAIVTIPQRQVDANLPGQSLCLYLDGIQDPGNFGTILRIADWFGIPYVFSSSDCVDPYNPKVVQAAMGALMRVGCIEISLAEWCRQYPGIPVYGAVMDGENIFHLGMKPDNGIIVIGSEGSGISPEAAHLISHRISIPPAAHSQADSLNAAIATGIVCAVFRNK